MEVVAVAMAVSGSGVTEEREDVGGRSGGLRELLGIGTELPGMT